MTNNKKNAIKAIYRRSFMLGAGSVLSLKQPAVALPQVKRIKLDYRSDMESIRGDWNRVGKQLAHAAYSLTNKMQ